MPSVSRYRQQSKVSSTPRRPHEKERIDAELRLCGEYGLRNKREIWRSQLVLAKTRKAARQLLTLPEKDPKRVFEGQALVRRLQRWGLLAEDDSKLDSVLQLTTQMILERRLQTKVFKQGLARSVHHARCLILQRHIAVGRQMVNAPNFQLRTMSEKHIGFAHSSPFGAGRPGRVARKKAKGGKTAAAEEAADE